MFKNTKLPLLVILAVVSICQIRGLITFPYHTKYDTEAICLRKFLLMCYYLSRVIATGLKGRHAITGYKVTKEFYTIKILQTYGIY